jgi:hypothetical protein
MAAECSFDIVSKIDLAEVDNAIDQTRREVATRYDLKGSNSSIERQERLVTLTTEDEMKIRSIDEIFRQKLAKRGVPLKGMTFSDPAPASGSRVRQTIEIQEGIPNEKAREIVKLIKDLKLKVQASIQGDQLRVRGAKKDHLQSVIQAIKEKDLGIHVEFTNYR